MTRRIETRIAAVVAAASAQISVCRTRCGIMGRKFSHNDVPAEEPPSSRMHPLSGNPVVRRFAECELHLRTMFEESVRQYGHGIAIAAAIDTLAQMAAESGDGEVVAEAMQDYAALLVAGKRGAWATPMRRP